jgi:mRNA interferase RelE/StbE
MDIQYQPSFTRDVKKASVEAQINLQQIIENLKSLQTLNEIHNLKKLKGFNNAYRIRITNYRLGFFYEDGKLILSRFLPRKDAYKFFP